MTLLVSETNETIYALTLERETAEDTTSVYGVRHLGCVERTDVSFCTVVQHGTRDELEEVDYVGGECWGCDGWLWEPPLSFEATALREAWIQEHLR